MALMAVLRVSSRYMASRLAFWTKKIIKNSDAKITTMMVSRIVKPFLFVIIIMVVPTGLEPVTLGL